MITLFEQSIKDFINIEIKHGLKLTVNEKINHRYFSRIVYLYMWKGFYF